MTIFSTSDVIAGAMAELAAQENWRRSHPGQNALEVMARAERTNTGPFQIVFCPEAEAPAEYEGGGR